MLKITGNHLSLQQSSFLRCCFIAELVHVNFLLKSDLVTGHLVSGLRPDVDIRLPVFYHKFYKCIFRFEFHSVWLFCERMSQTRTDKGKSTRPQQFLRNVKKLRLLKTQMYRTKPMAFPPFTLKLNIIKVLELNCIHVRLSGIN